MVRRCRCVVVAQPGRTTGVRAGVAVNASSVCPCDAVSASMTRDENVRLGQRMSWQGMEASRDQSCALTATLGSPRLAESRPPGGKRRRQNSPPRSLETRKDPDFRIFSSAPEGIRTPDLRFRRPTLYPAELRARANAEFSLCSAQCQPWGATGSAKRATVNAIRPGTWRAKTTSERVRMTSGPPLRWFCRKAYSIIAAMNA